MNLYKLNSEPTHNITLRYEVSDTEDGDKINKQHSIILSNANDTIVSDTLKRGLSPTGDNPHS